MSSITKVPFHEKIVSCIYDHPVERINIHVQSNYQVFQLYQQVMRHALKLKGEERKKYVTALKIMDNIQIIRLKAPAMMMDFSPIVKLLEQNQTHFEIDLETLKSDQPDLKDICKKLKQLSLDGWAYSFTKNILRSLIQSPQNYAVLAKERVSQAIVGWVQGVTLEISKPAYSTPLKVFFVWQATKDPKYPGLDLLAPYQALEKDLIRSKSLDYIALSVDQSKPKLQQKYAQYGFTQLSVFDNEVSKEPAVFMAKKVNQMREDTDFSHEDILSSIKQFGLKQWGIGGCVWKAIGQKLNNIYNSKIKS